MGLSDKQRAILRAVAAFDTIERYHGLLPKRLALLYDGADLARLEGSGLLERVKLHHACGRDAKGWRLTEAGRRLLPPAPGSDHPTLAPEHLRLLRDVYHASRISLNRGMMPRKLAKAYDADDLRDLYEHGYLLRIRISGQVTAKGWLVSNKGLSALGRRDARPAGATVCPVRGPRRHRRRRHPRPDARSGRPGRRPANTSGVSRGGAT